MTYGELEAQVARHGMTVREYQRNLVAMGTHGLGAEDREAIAERCIEARQRGEANVSVWHHAAAHFGTKCNCAMCEAAA